MYNILIDIYPNIGYTKKSQDKQLDSPTVRRSISVIIDQMNIYAVNYIEKQNEEKNKLIRLSYFFNPISYVQNIWNSCTSTDYNAYRDFRIEIQESISERNKLLVLELWKDNKVDKEKYKMYLEVLNN